MHPSFPVPVPDQTKKVTSMKKHIIKYLHFALGCFIMALAINVFLVQHHFLSGGIAGLGRHKLSAQRAALLHGL